jgi:cation:H+ antiporter
MLLLLFSVFLYYSAAEFSSASDAKAVRDAEAGRPRPPRSGVRRSRALARGLGGLAVLLIGADVAVSSALSIAELFGISKGLVGLSIVAIGTSLPELATSLIAAIRGQTNLAVGNVVGSNIFNLLFVLGATAFVSPVEIPVVGGQIDLLAMILFSVLLVPLSRAAGSHIPRAAGVLLFGAYVGFLAWRLSG